MAGLIVGGVAIGVLAIGALALTYGDKIKTVPALYSAAKRGALKDTLVENRKATETKRHRDKIMSEFRPSQYGKNSDVSVLSSDSTIFSKKDMNRITRRHTNSNSKSKHRRLSDSTRSSKSTPTLKRPMTWGGKNTRRRYK
jgi:hypothetical protein